MSKETKDWEDTLLLNRLWNLKIDELQRILSEMEALCSYIDLRFIDLNDYKTKNGSYKIEDIIRKIFIDSIGRTRAI